MTRPGQPLCWYVEEDGVTWCDAELSTVDGRYVCPNGHRLAQWDDLTKWTRDHIEFVQTDPGMLDRFFEPRGDRG